MDVEKVKQWSKEDKLRLLDKIVNDYEYDESNVPLLEALLDDEDPQVREMAVRGLWDYPEPHLIDRLEEIALHDAVEEVRRQALLTLGRFIYEGEESDYETDWGEGVLAEAMKPELPLEDFLRVKNFLLSFFRDERHPLDLRRYALESLGFLSDQEVLDLIEAAYNHPDRRMKISAIFAMGRSGHRRWRSIILKELRNPDGDIRYEAVRAAGELYLSEASPILVEIIENEEDKDLRMEAIWALGKTGGKEARRVLTELRDDPDKDIREVAEAALEELELTEMLDADTSTLLDYLGEDFIWG